VWASIAIRKLCLTSFQPQRSNKDLFLAGGRRLGIVAVAARIALTDACGLTAKSAQVVKLRASDATAFYQIDVVDDRRM
jgi:hypothetical protein